jgi:outer membrane receptor protein involved in Fe transport
LSAPWTGALPLGLRTALAGKPAPVLLGLVALGILPPATRAQGAGSILGRVTSTDEKANLSRALVSITGTGLSVLTGEAGWYFIVGVPPGRHEITVELPGYFEGRDTVELRADDALVLDFQLEPNPLPVDELVVSAEVRPSVKLAQGRVIGEEEIARRQASSVTQLLQGLVPELNLTVTSGDVGSAARVRLRGTRSLEASPPLFFIDGIRVGSAHFGGPVGTGSILTFLDNINPRDIQRIEILHAAEATTLFGTDAVGGAILIFTKR